MKPKRTKQIAGIIIGSLLMVGVPIGAGFLFASGVLHVFDTLGGTGVGDAAKFQSDMHTMVNVGRCVNAGSIIGLIILIVCIVSFVRAGRASQAP